MEDKNFVVRWNAVETLAQIKDTRAVAPLTKLLEYGGEYDRELAAKALGKIGDKNATQALIEALKDENKSVLNCIIIALGKIRDPKAVDSLINVFKDSKYDGYAAAYAQESLKS